MPGSQEYSKDNTVIEKFESFRERAFNAPGTITRSLGIAYPTPGFISVSYRSILTETEDPIDYIGKKLGAGTKTSELEAYCAYQLLLAATRLYGEKKTTSLNLNSFFHAIICINEFDLEDQEIIQQKITETGKHGTGTLGLQNDFSKKIITPIRNSGIKLEDKEFMLENQNLIERYLIYVTIKKASSLSPCVTSEINFNKIFNEIAKANRPNKGNLKILRNILSSKAEDIDFLNTSRNFGNQVKFPLSTRYKITELSKEEGPEEKSESRELCTFSEFKQQAHLLLDQAYSQLIQTAADTKTSKKQKSKMLEHFERIEHYIKHLEPKMENTTYSAELEAPDPVNEIGPEAKSETHEITCLFNQKKVSSCINEETEGLFALQDPIESSRKL